MLLRNNRVLPFPRQNQNHRLSQKAGQESLPHTQQGNTANRYKKCLSRLLWRCLVIRATKFIVYVSTSQVVILPFTSPQTSELDDVYKSDQHDTNITLLKFFACSLS
jgi:hypothetical protein